MEKKPGRGRKTLATCSALVLLGLVALSCCVAAEFKKAKDKDMKRDGNLCSMPRTAAFGLGVTALVCLSVAQMVGTSAALVRLLRSRGNKRSTSAAERRPAMVITMLALSWVSLGLATVLLGAGSSMNKGQPYGQGWADGQCYVVRRGVYLGSAALVAVTVALLLLTITNPMGSTSAAGGRTGPRQLQVQVHTVPMTQSNRIISESRQPCM